MKIKSCKSLITYLAAFSILFLALPGLAQNGAIQVKCIDASNNPVAGVKVMIIPLNSPKVKDKKSDAKGEAEFTKVDDSVYRVVGRKDGFEPALYDLLPVKGTKESVSLKMVAGAEKKLYFEDPAQPQKAFDLVKQGLEAYKQKNFADAEKLISQSIELDPSNADAYYYLGVSYLMQAKFDQGSESLNRAAKIAGALMMMPPTPQTPQYQQVVDSAQTLIKRMPAIKGETALKQKKFDEAIAAFSEAIKGEPNNPEYQANLAISLTNAKRFDDALPVIEKAIQLNPNEKAYTDLKNQINARKEDSIILKAQGLLDEGNALLKDGDAAGALKKFEAAKSLIAADKQSPVWRQIARAQAKLDQQDAAVAAYKKSIELAPADKAEEYRNSFAQYYLDAKKYDEALETLTAGGQNQEEVLLGLVKKLGNKEPQLAEAALERVIKANPQNADAHYELGRMYYADGKEKDARTKVLLAKYLEIGKDEAKLKEVKDLLIMVNRRTK
jgi:tetratricopeptide (TPR) repeat protein